MEKPYGDIPERFIQEGVFGYKQQLLHIGDRVEAIRNVQEIVAKGVQAVIIDILITPRSEGRGSGFNKRIVLQDYEGDFNPKRFKLAA